MRIQKLVDGIESKAIDRLQPMKDVMKPNVHEPNNPPALLILPNHEICSVVSGPQVNGVLSDVNIGVAIGSHPMMDP